MPTYEYACRSCGEHLEIVQSFADAPLTECPACKGELRKVFSPIGISFKGSGFYKTDSRGSSSKEPAKASSSDTASKSDSSGSSSAGTSSSEGAKSTTTSSSGGSSGASGSGSSGSSSGAGSSGSAAAS